LIEWIVWRLKIWWLKKYKYKDKNYRKVRNELKQYMELEAGPEYSFHYKAATTYVIVYAGLIFGPLMPLLNFVVLNSLIIQYIMDKILLTYFYRKPPPHCNQLSKMNF